MGLNRTNQQGFLEKHSFVARGGGGIKGNRSVDDDLDPSGASAPVKFMHYLISERHFSVMGVS